MYPEFIAIYIMLGIVILLLAAVLFFILTLLKKGVSNGSNTYVQNAQENDSYYASQQYPQYQQQYQAPGGNVVFCQQCSAQFDSSQAYCPQCGARR